MPQPADQQSCSIAFCPSSDGPSPNLGHQDKKERWYVPALFSF